MEWIDATKKQPKRINQANYGYVRPYVLCYTRYADPEFFIASYDPDDGEWSEPYSTLPVDVEYWCEIPEVPEVA